MVRGNSMFCPHNKQRPIIAVGVLQHTGNTLSFAREDRLTIFGLITVYNQNYKIADLDGTLFFKNLTY